MKTPRSEKILLASQWMAFSLASRRALARASMRPRFNTFFTSFKPRLYVHDAQLSRRKVCTERDFNTPHPTIARGPV